MNIQQIDDLRLMFLDQIAIETPEAAAKLFELRDSGQWMTEYRVQSDWLETFLAAALEEGRRHMDWIAARALGVAERTIRWWLQIGKLASNKPSGDPASRAGRRLVPVSEVNRIITESRVPARRNEEAQPRGETLVEAA